MHQNLHLKIPCKSPTLHIQIQLPFCIPSGELTYPTCLGKGKPSSKLAVQGIVSIQEGISPPKKTSFLNWTWDEKIALVFVPVPKPFHLDRAADASVGPWCRRCRGWPCFRLDRPRLDRWRSRLNYPWLLQQLKQEKITLSKNWFKKILKINMEHNNEGLVQMIFLCKWVIFRSNQPLKFPGCTLLFPCPIIYSTLKFKFKLCELALKNWLTLRWTSMVHTACLKTKQNLHASCLWLEDSHYDIYTLFENHLSIHM